MLAGLVLTRAVLVTPTTALGLVTTRPIAVAEGPVAVAAATLRLVTTRAVAEGTGAATTATSELGQIGHSIH